MTNSTHLITADELLLWPEDAMRHELLKGELLSYPYASALHGDLTARLIWLLAERAEANSFGRLCASSGFKLASDPDTVLAPDISFIRTKRAGPVSEGYCDGAPDLAVEVLEPDDDKRWFEVKICRWFEGGALSIWLVDAGNSSVDVRLSSGDRHILKKQDELTSNELLPDLRLRVSEIFDV